MTMSLIQTVAVSGTTSFSFSAIPQDATDLVILASLRSSFSAAGFDGKLTFNGSTTGYASRNLTGNGSTAASRADSFAYILFAPDGIPGNSNTANTFGNLSIYIPNYTSSTAKTISSDSVYENNATTAWQVLGAGSWTGTAAITSLTISLDQNLASGSTASLYKITKGSDGIVTTS